MSYLIWSRDRLPLSHQRVSGLCKYTQLWEVASARTEVVCEAFCFSHLKSFTKSSFGFPIFRFKISVFSKQKLPFLCVDPERLKLHWTWSACMLRCFSRVQLFATLWTVAPPGSSVRGILQARIPEWVAVPSSRGSSQPRNRTHVSYVSCVGRLVLYH